MPLHYRVGRLCVFHVAEPRRIGKPYDCVLFAFAHIRKHIFKIRKGFIRKRFVRAARRRRIRAYIHTQMQKPRRAVYICVGLDFRIRNLDVHGAVKALVGIIQSFRAFVIVQRLQFRFGQIQFGQIRFGQIRFGQFRTAARRYARAYYRRNGDCRRRYKTEIYF